MRTSALFSFLVVVLIAVACSSVLLVSANPSNEPNGKYCGSYLFGKVKGHGKFNAGSHKFDLSINAFDHLADCKDIDYSVDASTGQLIVPSAKYEKTCLGKMLIKNKLQADFKYDKNTGKIALNLGIAKVDLEHC